MPNNKNIVEKIFREIAILNEQIDASNFVPTDKYDSPQEIKNLIYNYLEYLARDIKKVSDAISQNDNELAFMFRNNDFDKLIKDYIENKSSFIGEDFNFEELKAFIEQKKHELDEIYAKLNAVTWSLDEIVSEIVKKQEGL